MYYFGLGPITIPKPELAKTFGDTVTDRETTFQRERENLDTDSMGYFSNKNGSLKPNLLRNIFRLFLKFWVYFQAFKNSYPQESSGKHEENLKLKVSVSEKN